MAYSKLMNCNENIGWERGAGKWETGYGKREMGNGNGSFFSSVKPPGSYGSSVEPPWIVLLYCQAPLNLMAILSSPPGFYGSTVKPPWILWL